MVHLSEHVGRYLVHPGGEVTTNLFKLVRADLHIELRAAMHLAREKNEVIHTKPIPLRIEGTLRRVVLSVYPADEFQQEGYLVVVFDDQGVFAPPAILAASVEPDARTDGATPSETTPSAESAPDQETTVWELDQELSFTRQRLQTVIEEYETGQEEMKASNEEMQSTNEELRSTMEELETSKEELSR